MTTRDRIVLITVLVVGGLAGLYFFGLKPKRAELAKLNTDIAGQQQQLDEARSLVASSRAARGRFAGDYATVARLGKAVPVDDDVPSLVYQLDTAAKRTGVDFRTMKLSEGGGTPAPPAPPTSSTPPSGSSGSTPPTSGTTPPSSGTTPPASGTTPPASGTTPPASGTTPPASGSTPPASGGATPASTSGAPATAAAAAVLPPGATVGSAGLPTLPFSFTFTGSFFNLTDFLRKLDRYVLPKGSAVDVNGRLLTVDGIALSVDPEGFPTIKASVAATAYLVPEDQGTVGGATPQGPPGGQTAPPSSGNGTAALKPLTATSVPSLGS